MLPTHITPDALVGLARRQGAAMVGSSCNAPLITADWAVEIFKVARARELGGVLQHVRDATRMAHDQGFWLELVTPVVPGCNDVDAQLTRAAQYTASLSARIPWHVTTFHRDYRMAAPDDISPETLLRAA